jgi:tRNA(fMet)-specific endonuclease VapC
MRYLLDSGIVHDYTYRKHDVYSHARSVARDGNILGIGTPILGELLGGVFASTSAERNLPILKRNLAHLRIWPFDEMAAIQYGQL